MTTAPNSLEPALPLRDTYKVAHLTSNRLNTYITLSQAAIGNRQLLRTGE